MKRKLTIAFLLAIATLATLFCAVACSEDTAHTHTGGTATCKTLAVCESCGESYGELDPENHESEEFTYASVGNGKHQKKHICCGTLFGDEEACAGGTATCVKKAECTTCGGEHGDLDPENHASEAVSVVPDSDNGDGTHRMKHDCCGAEYSVAHDYNAGYNTDDGAVDRKLCECGAISSDGFNKTAPANQKFILTDDVFSLSLEGVSAYDGVQSITLNDVDLGVDIAALDLSAFKGDSDDVKELHGAQEIKVVVKEGEYTHEITVSVILVTKKIATEADLKEVLRFGQDEGNVFGYYELENDIVYTGVQNKANFRGTFDGNGKTVTTVGINNGLFSYLYPGAVVKNLTIKATITQNKDNVYKSVLAASVYDDKTDKRPVTVENLTIVYAGGADSSTVFGGGFITRGTAKNVNFKNLTIRAAGKKIGSLLGTSVSGVTFENSVVIADELNCLAASADGTQRVEYAGVDGLTVITGSQTVEVTAETPSIDLKGLDNGRTIASIKAGTYLLGTDPAALTIPEEFINDKQSHGAGAVTVTFTDGSAIDLSVIFVTEILTTADDLNRVFNNAGSDSSIVKLYGYYVLGNDIDYTTHGGQNFAELYGVLDGNGKTLTVKNPTNGIIKCVKRGSVIKNLTINATIDSDSKYYTLIASNIGFYDKNDSADRNNQKATIENVTVNYSGRDLAELDGRGLICREGATSTAFVNLAVNADGKKIGALFGQQLSGCTFTNCSVTASEVNCVACKADGFGKVGIADVTGITWNVSGATA